MVKIGKKFNKNSKLNIGINNTYHMFKIWRGKTPIEKYIKCNLKHKLNVPEIKPIEKWYIYKHIETFEKLYPIKDNTISVSLITLTEDEWNKVTNETETDLPYETYLKIIKILDLQPPKRKVIR
jgi:hypothetical protein